MTSKRKSLTVNNKIEALLSIDRGEKKSEISKRLNVAKSTLSTWIKSRDKIFKTCDNSNPNRKRYRQADFNDIEEALLRWFTQARLNALPISGPMCIAQAKKFADAFGYDDFQASSGWLHRFKLRHGIHEKSITGESGSVSDDMMSEWKTVTLPRLLKMFAPKDIYNMDETGLFFRLTPERTLTFKNDPCHGGKKSKERLTAVICANMDGSDKLDLLVIGKFEKPRCFKNIKTLPVQYHANTKAWMTSGIFEQWIRKLDRQFQSQNRKVLMIVDNCPSHTKLLNLKSITMQFLPVNTTSHLQPMDQGIIQNLKIFYRRIVIERVLNLIENDRIIDNKKISVLDAIHMLHSAWHQVRPETIANCFRHAGFEKSSSDEIGDYFQQQATIQMEEFQSKWDRIKTLNCLVPLKITLEDFLRVDENIAISEALTEAEIVKNVITQSNTFDEKQEGNVTDDECNDDESSEVQTPTIADAISAITVLRTYFACTDTISKNAVFNQLAHFEDLVLNSKPVRQTLISDFFTSYQK